MARPSRTRVPAALTASGAQMEQVSGNPIKGVSRPSAIVGSASVYKQHKGTKNKSDDRTQIAKHWQIEAYRHINICGEARYAVTLFASLAARAEIGVSEPQALARRAVWVNSGPEVEAFAELAPTVRDRTRLVRDYMLHRSIAGECYLIARDRREQDPEYETRRHEPIWEIVAVTELRKHGDTWQVRMDNELFVDLAAGDPVIRIWNPDPENRREAWSPIRSLLPVLREIEWLTGHIFTQIRSRLMSAGVWFVPDNLTFPPPPPEAVEGGEEAIAAMNEAEQFMMSLAASGQYELDLDEVSFPTVVMADPSALANIDKSKLIQFWSEIDDKAMTLRQDRVRAFALGMDLPPEQVLGSSGVAVAGSGGSAGSVNHWGEWANEEKTIAGHIEPALNDLVDVLTVSFLRAAVDGTDKVIAYDPTSIRMKQDRSKIAVELYQMGLLDGPTTVREAGFDPENDMMDDAEFRRWMLIKVLSGSPTPEMMLEAMKVLGQVLNVPVSGNEGDAKGLPGPAEDRNLDDHPVQGPPQVQHDHSPAPYTTLHASAEVLVLRALEKAGNRLLNDGKRGRQRDRTTPPHLAHLSVEVNEVVTPDMFDFTLLPTVMNDIPAGRQARIGGALHRYCVGLYASGEPYTRESLIEAMKGL
jgi:hypothetical protein